MDVEVNVEGFWRGIYTRISQERLYPKGIFRCFFLGFAFNTLRGYWSGFQAFDRDIAAAAITDSVCPIIDALKGLTDFDDQFPLSVSNTEHKVSIRLEGGAICGVGETGDLSCHA